MKKIILYILFIFSTATAFSQTAASEAELKAVFIYNFTRYIEWRPEDLQENFVIGVLGSSPVATALIEISKTAKIKNRKFVVRYYDKLADITGCNILFIPSSTSFSLESILQRKQTGMLTVSESPGFASQGMAINFINIRNKLKFEANLDAIDKAELSASSQLLKLAEIVKK